MSTIAFLTILAGVVQVSPSDCEFYLLHPNGDIDTHTVNCKYIVEERLLPIK